MTIGLTIPGVTTVHPREVWEPFAGYTVAGQNPPKQEPARITQPVAHYTAADNLIDGDPGEHAGELPRYLGNMHRYYVESRGYAIGYLFAVDWLGGVWEQRGFDYRSAANKDHNSYTAPILCLVDGADPVTPAAAASLRAVWREFRRRSGRSEFVNRPKGHGQLYLETGKGTQTSCPGGGIQHQIAGGVLDLDTPTPKPQPPASLPGVSRSDPGWYWVIGGDSPWSASERIYRKPDPDRLIPTIPAEPGFGAPNHWIRTPGVATFDTKVQPGEGPYAVMDRMHIPKTKANLQRFYDFNGGPNRVLQPNDWVVFPDEA